MRCAWCGEKAVTQIEIEPAKRGKDKRTGLMVIKKPPLMSPACVSHKDIINEQPPFYTCGCSYIDDQFRCPRHNNLLRHPFREKFTKSVIKDAPKQEQYQIR